MEKISDLYSEYRDYILFLILLIMFLAISFFIFYYFKQDINSLRKEMKERPIVEVKKEEKQDEYTVDIKGEVKKPGVYNLTKDKRVMDVVNKAGGLTNKADTSANNLSMKIVDEMVIVIYSKDEIKNYLSTKEKEESLLEKCEGEVIKNDSCFDNVNVNKSDSSTKKSDTTKKSITAREKSNSNNIENKLISINTATKEELMTLPSIGEAKADAIIEYRSTKKFESIEEIKEVSGIGDSLFEKIKDYITT